MFEKVDKSDDDPDDVDDGGMNPAEEAIVDLLEVEGMERLSEKVYFQGLASHCKAEATLTFHYSILTLLNAF